VDAVVTDPPYGVGLGTKPNNQRSIREDRQYTGYEDTEENLAALVAAIMPELFRVAKRVALTPGVRNMWLYPRPKHTGSLFYPSATGCNSWGFSCWQPILFYGKDPYGGKGSRPDSKQSTERAERNGHPCPKPIGQWTWLLERATLPGETVLDPFMGSGTTGVACVNTGRNFIGIEIDAGYYAIAERRIAEAQAKQSELLIA
jgi:site-specific DNA-methyltransferase (adenine-specific)